MNRFITDPVPRASRVIGVVPCRRWYCCGAAATYKFDELPLVRKPLSIYELRLKKLGQIDGCALLDEGRVMTGVQTARVYDDAV